MSSLLLILLSAALINLAVIGGPPAWRPFAAIVDVYEAARALVLASLLLLPIVSVASWALSAWVLAPLDLTYLRTLVFIAVLLVGVFGVETVLRRHAAFEPQRPGFVLLLTTNAAALGAALLVEARADGLLGALLLSIGAAVAFAVLLLAFASMHERLRGADAPAPVRDAPLALITAGLMALGLLGFTGLVQE